MDNKLDYNLKEVEDFPEIKVQRCPKKNIIILVIVAIVLITALVLILYFTLSGKDEEQEQNPKPIPIPVENSTITFIPNISYVNDKIVNSFKKGGANYLADLGEINNGEDYEKNDQNFYDIYFPEKERINISKPIILMIHGGAWTDFPKEIMAGFCKAITESGYISVTMGYTLLGQKGTKSNIFRTIDETNYVISSIKKTLKDLGYDEKQLKIAIAGESSGAHQALLYSYLNKIKTEIPVKFTINFFAPVTLERQYYYRLVGNQSFDNIDPETIKEAEENGKIEQLNTTLLNPFSFVNYMNLFLGGHLYTEEQLKKMIKDWQIDTENEDYKNLLSKAKYGFPITFITKDSLPTISVYGGVDVVIGIKHYAYLKTIFEKEGHYNNVLIYGKEFDHVYFFYQDKNTFEQLLFQIQNFTELYILK